MGTSAELDLLTAAMDERVCQGRGQPGCRYMRIPNSLLELVEWEAAQREKVKKQAKLNIFFKYTEAILMIRNEEFKGYFFSVFPLLFLKEFNGPDCKLQGIRTLVFIPYT